MSRRNRTNRRRQYGKRQHEVRERRPSDAPADDLLSRDDGWLATESMDDTRRNDDTYEGWAR